MKKKTIIKIGAILVVFALIIINALRVPEKIEGIEKYAKRLEDVKLPNDKTVYALGEATHGNSDFQKLKLEVFKKLYEENNTRAFLLESDFAGGRIINRYINADDSITLDDAIWALDFKIYKTEDMKNLIEWMREVNENAKSEDDKVRFYGFDCQNVDKALKLIYLIYDKNGIKLSDENKEKLERLFNNKEYSQGKDSLKVLEERNNFIGELILDFERIQNDKDKKDLIYTAQNMKTASQLVHADSLTYSLMRDKAMKENIDVALSYEKEYGKDKVFVSAQNEHVSRVDTNFCHMGKYLKDKYDDKYYVIGTAFYKSTCNINNGTKRVNYHFTVKNPLAYQVKLLDEKNINKYDKEKNNGINSNYFIDVKEASESKICGKYFKEAITDGTLGEKFELYYYLLPYSYKQQIVVNGKYDGYIIFYNVEPLRLLEEK